MNYKSKIVSFLLVVAIVFTSTINCFAIEYSYSNKTLEFRSLKEGELSGQPYVIQPEAESLIFDSYSYILTDDVVLNGRDFSYIKESYPKMTSMHLNDCRLANNQIPANAFLFEKFLFKDGHGLSEFKIQKRVRIDKIGDWAFHYCRNLEEFSTEEPIEILGTGVFAECTDLKTVRLEGTKTIGNNAFYNCTQLSDLLLGSSVTSIGSYAFYNNNALLSADHFWLSALGEHAYAESDSLVDVSFPALLHIPYAAFKNNTKLEEAYLPAARDVDGYAFSNNRSLTRVTMPLLERIEPYGFAGSSSLTTLNLPELRTIGQGAFQGCSSLSSLTLGPRPPEVSGDPFSGLPSDRTLYVPTSARNAYDSADGVIDNKWHGWNFEKLSSECDMLSFSFDKFSPRRQGEIANTNWVWIKVPYKADVSSLVPTIRVSQKATVTVEINGVHENAIGRAVDFTGTNSNNQADLVHYTVRSERDSDTKHYYIRVSEDLSDEKDIRNFSIDGQVSSLIDEENRSIIVTLGNNTNLSNLTPTIEISEGAIVVPNSNIAQNFTNPVDYTVTAADGSTKTYTVSVLNENHPPELSGSVNIQDDGTPQFGEELRANVSDTNNTGTLIYQWKRGSINIGTNSSRYMITADDLGENIGVEVRSDTEINSLKSINTVIPAKADYTASVLNPIESLKTYNSIILVDVDGYEYKERNTSWQDSNTFNGLNPNTEYYFTQRAKATNTHNASITSSAISISTDTLPLDALTGIVNIIGSTTYGERLTAEVIGSNELGILAYQWQANGIDISGATSSTYRLGANEIGKIISVEVRDTDTGNGARKNYIESNATTSIDKEVAQTPDVPSMESKTDSSITLVKTLGYEYRSNGGNWQDSNIFMGLDANTSYSFTQRIKESTTAYSSDESDLATFTTSVASSKEKAKNRKNARENEFAIKIPSIIVGKDRVFEASRGGAKVKIKGWSLSKYKDKDVEIFIQRLDNRHFDLDIPGKFSEAMLVFDISLMVDGIKVAFNSDNPLQIEFELEDDYDNHKVVAIYISDDGSYEILEGLYDGKVMTFKTNHLSNYALIYVDKSFADSENHWAHEAIEALAAREIVKGRSENRFDPNGIITRAEYTALMVRYFKLISYATDLAYTDIGEDSWYANYVWTARELGILPENYGDRFKPNNEITREEMIYILYKSLEVSNKLEGISDNGDRLSDFTDGTIISDYAVKSAEALISRDIINGNSDGSIRPNDTATRAEIAQVLYNLLNIMN